MKNSFFTSIAAKILATSILPAIFACLLLTLFYLDKRTDESRNFLENRGSQLAREISAISEFALISGNTEYLDDAISKLVEEPEIYSIKILDEERETFLYRESNSNKYTDADKPQDLMRFENPAYRLFKEINTFDLSDDMNLDQSAQPGDDSRKRQLVGYVEVQISTHVLQNKRVEIIQYGIGLAVAVFLISALIGLLYSRSLLNPIKRIVHSVKDMRSGNYESRIASNSADELGDLSNNIDKLAAELKTSKEEIGRKILELTDARETADRANATKSMFLARVSHELRDPLTAVVGNLEILFNTETSEYQERAICLAEKNTEFLLRQIDDILEFSLLESGQYNIDLQYFNISELTELVSNITKPKAAQKELAFSINLDIEPELSDCYIESDPIRIQQILINLIGNAIKFTHIGSVEAKISLKRISQDNNEASLEIHVLDTGIGIAESHLSNIFEMFEQVQSPISRQYGGTGLGLSITKHIVEALGGNISVESEPDKGSCFSVNLNIRFITKQAEISSTSARNEYKTPDLKTNKILLIEDNADNQRVVSTLLHNIGMEVDIANHGAEGLDKFKRNKYDIIFVDCFMPHMDGFEFTRRVREHESQSRTPSKAMLIGLTAGAHKQNIEKCYACGMDDVITKPFYRIDIYKRVLGFKTAQKMLEKLRKD